jgi:hypothetical protein
MARRRIAHQRHRHGRVLDDERFGQNRSSALADARLALDARRHDEYDRLCLKPE